MTPRLNRNLRVGERRYRLLGHVILELEKELSPPPDRDMIVRLDVIVDRARQASMGRGCRTSMTPHRVAHLLRELECGSERVRDRETLLPATLCHVPASVRNLLHDLKDRGEWLWGKEQAPVQRVSRSPPPMETWEARLQFLRIRLHREPTQDEMLEEWTRMAKTPGVAVGTLLAPL